MLVLLLQNEIVNFGVDNYRVESQHHSDAKVILLIESTWHLIPQ
jgi:hypothetical protein